MKNKLGKTAATIGFAIAALAASATAEALAARTNGQDVRESNMRIYEETRAPIGHVLFCRANPEQCRSQFVASPRVPELTNARWNELVEINDSINRAVEPVTDMELYRTIEHWTYPQGAGDCEDYVLEKQRELVRRGWPAESLLITVVRDENNEGHAVLTVTTDAGDFVLDNRYPMIRRWQDTPYTFRKRQSQHNPVEWVSLTRGSLFGQISGTGLRATPVTAR